MKAITKEELIETLYDGGYPDEYINKIINRFDWITNSVMEIWELVDIIKDIEEGL